MFRQNGQLVSAPCGDTTFLCVEAKPFVDTELKLMIQEPTVYTDLKMKEHPKWVGWVKDIGDCTMPRWSKD